MVKDIEELRSKLQHPAFSQEAQLCLLNQRKVPIPFGRPTQDIASGSAKLADKAKAIRPSLLRSGARRDRWEREHGRIEPLIGIACNDSVGIVDDRLVSTWIASGW